MRFRKPDWQKIMLAFFMDIMPRMVKDHFQKQITKSKKEVPTKIIHQPDADLIRNAEIMNAIHSSKTASLCSEADQMLIVSVIYIQELLAEKLIMITNPGMKCQRCGDYGKKLTKIFKGELVCSLCYTAMQIMFRFDSWSNEMKSFKYFRSSAISN